MKFKVGQEFETIGNGIKCKIVFIDPETVQPYVVSWSDGTGEQCFTEKHLDEDLVLLTSTKKKSKVKKQLKALEERMSTLESDMSNMSHPGLMWSKPKETEEPLEKRISDLGVTIVSNTISNGLSYIDIMCYPDKFSLYKDGRTDDEIIEKVKKIIEALK